MSNRKGLVHAERVRDIRAAHFPNDTYLRDAAGWIERARRRMTTLDEDNTYLNTIIDRLQITIEARNQRISQLEKAIDLVLEADHYYDLSRRDAWQTVITVLRLARRERGATVQSSVHSEP